MSCINVPVVVAELSLPGQTGPIATTTVFSPTVSDFYRISIMVQNQPSGAHPGWLISWADSGGAITVPAGSAALENGLDSYTVTFYAVSGTDIQISPNFSASLNYNLYVLLEQL